jgi:hypothetical protein
MQIQMWKQQNKELGMILNLQHFRGKRGVLEL